MAEAIIKRFNYQFDPTLTSDKTALPPVSACHELVTIPQWTMIRKCRMVYNYAEFMGPAYAVPSLDEYIKFMNQNKMDMFDRQENSLYGQNMFTHCCQYLWKQSTTKQFKNLKSN